MDKNRFDELARRLGNRRSLLGSLILALTPVVVQNRPEIAAKPKKKRRKKCKKGRLKCGKACVNALTDAQNCGSCGNACAAGTACVQGVCTPSSTPTCPESQTRCGSQCVDTSSDENHCGRCNLTCTGDLTCLDGTCGCADNADTQCGTDCVNTRTDPDNCGTCGTTCGAGKTCESSSCVPDGDFCNSQSDCGGQFSDLQCVNNRCVCIFEGEFRCTGEHRFQCAECCPGGKAIGERCYRGGGDWVCINNSRDGCTCPEGQRTCRNDTRLCTMDPLTDSHRCGDNCSDCSVSNPGSSCCNGFCNRGCNPGESCGGGANIIPCPANNCQACPPGQTCCNRGDGTPASCVNFPGSFCPGLDFYDD